MIAARQLADGVYALETSITPAPGFTLPLRTTLLRLPSGGLAVISPLAVDDALAATIEAWGPVEHLVAPNRFHHLFVAVAAARWPKAKVWLSPGLPSKRPDLRYDALLGVDGGPPGLEVVRIEGSPWLEECAVFHPPSGTLVVTDLVFHVLEPSGCLTAPILWLVGAHRRFAQGLEVKALVWDRAAAAASVRRLLALDVQRVVMAHGEVVDDDAPARLREALRWMSRG